MQRLSSKKTTIIFRDNKPGIAVKRVEYHFLGIGSGKKTTKQTAKKPRKDLWKAWSKFWKKQFERG